ncbi:MAG: Uma2 family endonuclease [Gemmataceae bacterium]|nr:Uma2 family endonuclease [Gemmataceae bacterium]
MKKVGTQTMRGHSGPFTYDDFCALVNDDQKADLIDGVIYMASPENTDANELFVWILGVMNLFARRRKLGKVYGSRVACRLDRKNGPEPDVVFVATRNLGRVKRGGIEGPPDLAVEIVSPDSVERDYEKKRRQYEQFCGVQLRFLQGKQQSYTGKTRFSAIRRPENRPLMPKFGQRLQHETDTSFEKTLKNRASATQAHPVELAAAPSSAFRNTGSSMRWTNPCSCCVWTTRASTGRSSREKGGFTARC